MVLEGGKASNRLPVDLETGNAVGHALLCVRKHPKDFLANLRKRAPFWLVERVQVGVDLLCRHRSILRLLLDSGNFVAIDGSPAKRPTRDHCGTRPRLSYSRRFPTGVIRLLQKRDGSHRCPRPEADESSY